MSVRSLLAVALTSTALLVSLPQLASAGGSTVNATAQGYGTDVGIDVRADGTVVDSSVLGSHAKQRLKVRRDRGHVRVNQFGTGSRLNAEVYGMGGDVHMFAGGCATGRPMVFTDRSRSIGVASCR